jgi:valyl-tRNA synthetase
MNLDGTINTERLREELNAHDNPYLQAYHGKDRYEVRKLIVADLEAGGYLEKVEDYTVPLARCERCHTVIEPLLSEQWFCRMTEIAKPAIEVVKQGKIRFIPERYTEMYLNWMENIRDWCISRQLWWGHQIPAWYCVDCNPENFERTEKGEYRLLKRENPIVQKTAPDKCPRCGSMLLVRDPDVLDTWFSSAIWPPHGAGLAPRHGGVAPLLPHRCADHSAGDSLPVGRPHDYDGAVFQGRHSLP